MNTPQRTRIIIDVDFDFHKQVKLLALERDKSIRQLVTECLVNCITDSRKNTAWPPGSIKNDPEGLWPPGSVTNAPDSLPKPV